MKFKYVPFVIAEIGINHNGDLKIAKQLIDKAVELKIDAVKFQKRTIDIVYDQELLNQARESPWGKTQRDQKEGLEFGQKEYQEIDEYCQKNKIDWFASAWDLQSLEFLKQFNLKYNKIASAMIVDKDFLSHVAKQKIHTFISTGMTDLKDIEYAVNLFKENDCPFELMHCVSTYPMKPEYANLRTIEGLRKKFNCDVGYSGHEAGVAISIAATTLGISSLERHITLDRSMYGSDQAASLEPRGFRELMGSIDKVKLCLGENKIGHFFEDEKPIADKLRAHIKNN